MTPEQFDLLIVSLRSINTTLFLILAAIILSGIVLITKK